MSTLINSHPTLTYANLNTLISQAASIVKDRPVTAQKLTEKETVLLIVNQLLLGQSSTASICICEEAGEEMYMVAATHQEELIKQCSGGICGRCRGCLI